MFTVDQLNPDQLEEAAELWFSIQGSESLKTTKKKNTMFITISETMEYGVIRETIINKNYIEAITFNKNDFNKIKIHLTCGKEFNCDIKYLEKLLS